MVRIYNFTHPDIAPSSTVTSSPWYTSAFLIVLYLPLRLRLRFGRHGRQLYFHTV